MPEASPILGIPELDAELAPLLPPGWLALVEGRSGTGLPLVAKQFAHAGVGHAPVYYYTTYERSEDVARAFTEYGWKTDGVSVVNLSGEYYDRVLRRDLEVSRTRERGLTLRDVSDPSSTPVQRRTFNLENRLLADLVAIDGPFRLVLDSLDFFLEVLEPTEVTRVARQIGQLAQEYGGQAMLIIQAEIHDAVTRGLLQNLADLVIELRAEPRADVYEHILEIRKVRNHPERTRRMPVKVSSTGLVMA